MNTRKRLLVLLCLIYGLAQAPLVKAQGVDPLTAIAYKLMPMAIPAAATVAATCIPIVVSTTVIGTKAVVIGVRSVPLLPGMIKEKVSDHVSIKIPRPHFGRDKKHAPDSKTAKGNEEGTLAANADVSATITGEEGEMPAREPGETALDVAAATPNFRETVQVQISANSDTPVIKHKAIATADGGWQNAD